MELYTCYPEGEGGKRWVILELESSTLICSPVHHAAQDQMKNGSLTTKLVPNRQENEDFVPESLDELGICPTELRKNVFYIRYYILLGNFVVMVLIPFVLLISLNSFLYKIIIRKRILRSSSRQTRDQRIAMILITIVLIFMVCSIPRVVINGYEV